MAKRACGQARCDLRPGARIVVALSVASFAWVGGTLGQQPRVQSLGPLALVATGGRGSRRSPRRLRPTCALALRRLIGVRLDPGVTEVPVFNADSWLWSFQSERSAGNDVRNLRLDVQQGTLDALNVGRYSDSKGRVVALPSEEMTHGLGHAAVYDEDTLGTFSSSGDVMTDDPFGRTKVRVRNMDCLEAAAELLDSEPGAHVAVLNMANEYSPGGDWQGGCGTQEENLHRRTNLCDHLSNFRQLLPEPPVKYPLPEFGGAFSPGVCVFRGSEAQGYPFLSQPQLVSVMSVAAYCRPRCCGGRLEEYFADGMRRKIEAMLRSALFHNVSHLVLSALGCGAFENPPLHVAEIFRESLIAEEFRGQFKAIDFAILEDSNSAGRRHGSDLIGNLAPFARVFEVSDEGGVP